MLKSSIYFWNLQKASGELSKRNQNISLVNMKYYRKNEYQLASALSTSASDYKEVRPQNRKETNRSQEILTKKAIVSDTLSARSSVIYDFEGNCATFPHKSVSEVYKAKRSCPKQFIKCKPNQVLFKKVCGLRLS